MSVQVYVHMCTSMQVVHAWVKVCVGVWACVYIGMCMYGYRGACVHECLVHARICACTHIYIHAFTDTPDASTLHTSEAQCAPPQEMLTHSDKFSHYLV